MTITELSNDMKKYCGGSSFITRKKLADYMGMTDVHTVDKKIQKGQAQKEKSTRRKK